MYFSLLVTKNFFKNFNFLVCTIIIKFINLLIFWKLGALTSKPFAYKAWSWELSTSYIVDVTNSSGAKLRVDLKGLEIVWILPWLNNSFSENWITDKSRFFYDGLTLNWISKFFIKKKILLIPCVFLFFHTMDPLFLKYFFKKYYFLKKNNILIFKNSKQNIFNFMFSLFIFINFFEKLFIGSINTFEFTDHLFLNKNWNKWIYLLGSFKFFHRVQKLPFLNFCTLWKNFFKNFYYFTTVLPNVFCFSILLNLLPIAYKKKFNFFFNSDLDTLNLSFLWNFNFTTVNLGLPFKLTFNSLIRKNKFNFFYDNNFILKFNIIFLINTNLWLSDPWLHLQLWWNLKLSEQLIISLGNSDELLFWHLNLGMQVKPIINFLNAKHWLTNFLIKKITVSFFINFETNILKYFNFKIFLNTKKLLTFLKFKNKYVIPVISYYYTSTMILINQINYLSFFNFWKIVSEINNLNLTKKNSMANFYIFTSNYNSFFNFLLSFFNKNNQKLKKNYFFLIESNLKNSSKNLDWDCILPLTILTENFFQFKSLKAFSVKSLFIKFGPWYAWNLFTYLNFFVLYQQFPYFWLNNTLKFFNYIDYLFFIFWLTGTLNIFSFQQKYQLNSSKILNFNIKISIWKIKKFKFFNFSNWNFWSSNLSFVINSKYINFGINSLVKEPKTFLN